ncbi:MAG: hypothetical protein JWL59_3864 [Chthoniobacteraceae bacterium]|nr:hypothetical protein [Chthoniobacteraceae bacterium]
MVPLRRAGTTYSSLMRGMRCNYCQLRRARSLHWYLWRSFEPRDRAHAKVPNNHRLRMCNVREKAAAAPSIRDKAGTKGCWFHADNRWRVFRGTRLFHGVQSLVILSCPLAHYFCGVTSPCAMRNAHPCMPTAFFAVNAFNGRLRRSDVNQLPKYPESSSAAHRFSTPACSAITSHSLTASQQPSVSPIVRIPCPPARNSSP